MDARRVTPQVARLADALGIDSGVAAACVRWLVRNAGEWAPWAGERDLAVMLRSPYGSLLRGVTDEALAEALVYSRLVVIAESSGKFEPSEWLSHAISVESARKEMDKQRKRALAAESARKESGFHAESTPKEAGNGPALARAATSASSVSSPPASFDIPELPVISAASSAAELRDWLFVLAAWHGYKRYLTRDFQRWLLARLAEEFDYAMQEIVYLFRMSEGAGNRRQYIEKTYRERRRDWDRAPPTWAEEDREWQRANGFEPEQETGKVLQWPK